MSVIEMCVFWNNENEYILYKIQINRRIDR